MTTVTPTEFETVAAAAPTSDEQITAALALLDAWMIELSTGAKLLDRETTIDRVLDVANEIRRHQTTPAPATA